MLASHLYPTSNIDGLIQENRLQNGAAKDHPPPNQGDAGRIP